MSGALRRFGEYLGLLEDTGRYDEVTGEYIPDEDLLYADEAGQAVGGGTLTSSRTAVPATRRATPASVSDLSERRRLVATPEPVTELSRIVRVAPETFNDARIIGENYREGVPVIMNLAAMQDVDPKRLVDFASGLVFASRGSLERVANNVFLLCPPNVAVADEDKERLAEGGFFNQS